MSATPKNPLLELESAEVRYQGVLALQNIGLKIFQGEKLALVGRSGSGKSTLLKLIYQNFPQRTTLLPQEDGLVQTLSVFHNVYMGQLNRHSNWYNVLNLIKPKQQEITAVEKILQQVQLEEKIFEPCGKLSGGQKQRTAVARSLYQGGELLLADEPVSAVDEHQSRLVLDALCGTFPSAVLAMHDIDLALEYCDRIIGLKNGRLILDNATRRLSRADLLPLYRD